MSAGRVGAVDPSGRVAHTGGRAANRAAAGLVWNPLLNREFLRLGPKKNARPV